ncbi:hypothetical protein CDAR_7891 [Caerostris darwini]|uniref:Uncharacterized protein n=1 Tax=Caerostris darwini TaxID=1538125 RepID=A0AAV4QBR7_9ARAC|nr:hypothetical protein CDAR_7891 [Caerostris darwini]
MPEFRCVSRTLITDLLPLMTTCWRHHLFLACPSARRIDSVIGWFGSFEHFLVADSPETWEYFRVCWLLLNGSEPAEDGKQLMRARSK